MFDKSKLYHNYNTLFSNTIIKQKDFEIANYKISLVQLLEITLLFNRSSLSLPKQGEPFS